MTDPQQSGWVGSSLCLNVIQSELFDRLPLWIATMNNWFILNGDFDKKEKSFCRCQLVILFHDSSNSQVAANARPQIIMELGSEIIQHILQTIICFIPYNIPCLEKSYNNFKILKKKKSSNNSSTLNWNCSFMTEYRIYF